MRPQLPLKHILRGWAASEALAPLQMAQVMRAGRSMTP
jgi:hypothetical protein